jgi:hypothetical protein
MPDHSKKFRSINEPPHPTQIFAVEFPDDENVVFTVRDGRVTLRRDMAEAIAKRILKDELYPMPERIIQPRDVTLDAKV